MQGLLRSWFCLAFLASIAVGQTKPPAPPATKPSDATDLSILYAGSPGSEREKHFVEFLEAWFPEVQTISLEALDSKAAEPFDVVVADWKPRYDKAGNPLRDAGPKANLRFDQKYSKPTVCLGAVGSEICGGKLDWL